MAKKIVSPFLPLAQKYAKEALNLELSNPTSLQILGQIYLDSGKYDAAFECYKQILQEDPKSSFGHFGMGVYFARIGNTKRAKESFRKVKAFSPNDSLAEKAEKHLLLLNEENV